MDKKQKTKVVLFGIAATALLFGAYFVIVTAISGFPFALAQFKSDWQFLISLAVGFGIQISLYTYLKEIVKNSSMKIGGETVAVTGTTSTLAMISCCAHYLVNIVPILGISGALAVIAQYQTKIFWIGIAFNVFGIWFISNKIISFKKQHG